MMSNKPTMQRMPTKPPGHESGQFTIHCRTFDTQLKELSQQLSLVKERLNELHRDVSLLRRANTPPIGSRYDHIARDCRILEQQLEHQQMELESLRTIFDGIWEEQMCRIRIEKEIFHSQVSKHKSPHSNAAGVFQFANIQTKFTRINLFKKLPFNMQFLTAQNY